MDEREAREESFEGEAAAADGGVRAGAVGEAEAGGGDRGVGNPMPLSDHCHGYTDMLECTSPIISQVNLFTCLLRPTLWITSIEVVIRTCLAPMRE